jgi:hypothetical protein
MLKHLITKLRSQVPPVTLDPDEVLWLHSFLLKTFDARSKGGQHRYKNHVLSTDPADIRNRERVAAWRSKQLTK